MIGHLVLYVCMYEVMNDRGPSARRLMPEQKISGAAGVQQKVGICEHEAERYSRYRQENLWGRAYC